MEINQEVLDNALEIYANLKVEDGESYRPANGTEGDIFESRWCCNCQLDIDEKNCEIVTLAFCGGQPQEWIYYGNKPICTAFRRSDNVKDCPDCDSKDTKYHHDHGYGECLECSQVWAYSKDDPDYQESPLTLEEMREISELRPFILM